jgi:hypothetical protein
MSETGWYLYAISRDVTLDKLGSTEGLLGEPLRVVEHGGLCAVVSAVDLDEFGETGLRRNLEDLSWLEKVARGHDTVVQSTATAGPTAPLRLATICLDDDGIRARLEEWHDALVHTLDRIEGRMEWSAKTYSSGASADDESGASEASGAGSGAAYLQRKKRETLQKQTAEEAAHEVAEEIHAALAQHAVASRRLQPQDPRLTGHEGTMTLNGAYLVETSRSDVFESAARELAARHPGSRLEVHGPWPPYSFATLDDA